jgi:hypothetical protein
MTNEIDLSQLVGQKVVCKFGICSDLIGRVELSDRMEFPYSIANYHFTFNGEGYTHQDIKSISLLKEIPPLTGIAQKHPNINLEDFRDQKVFIKWSTLGIPHSFVQYNKYGEYWNVGNDTGFHKDGTIKNSSIYIEEIYGPGAYYIVTKEIPDEPTDPAVEKAREAVKNLTEEQIAKLLHTLKK